MGQTLSEPVVDKHSGKGASKRFAYAYSEMQGWRISMEDAHATILSLPPRDSVDEPTRESVEKPLPEQTSVDGEDGSIKPAFFAVYDGHGGSTVAKYTGQTLHNRLAAIPEYAQGDYETALTKAFLKTDDDLRANPDFSNDPSGCTAVACLITADDRIICANAGDSRAVLGLAGKEKPMSHDHKPVNKEEAARITAAGGFVEYGRVNGNLALSRAVGDFEFKQNFSLDAEHQAVTVNPDVIVHEWTGDEEFLVVACDGIWDCLSSQQVVDFTRRAIANGDSLTKIAEDMMEKCLAPDSELGGVGCDNMTVVVVALLHGKTEDEWRAWVTERVKNNVGYTTPESVPDVFKTPPVYNRQPKANGVAASGSGSTAGARVQGGGNSLAELLQGGKMLGGISIQDMLAGTGINLSSAGLLAGEGEDSEEEDDDEGAHVEGEDGKPTAAGHPRFVNSPTTASEQSDGGDADMLDGATPKNESTTAEAPAPAAAAEQK